MKTTLLIAAAAVSLAMAGGAQAQVLGGVGGSIGGRVSATPGNLGVRDTIGATRGLAGDTLRDGRDAVRDVRGSTADASAAADAAGTVAADRNGATVDFSGSLGADVASSAGGSLGRVVGMGQDAASGARFVLVQAADGAIRGVRSTDVEITGSGSLDSNLTAYEFRRLPEQQAQAQQPRSSDELPDDTRRDPAQTDEDRAN